VIHFAQMIVLRDYMHVSFTPSSAVLMHRTVAYLPWQGQKKTGQRAWR